MTPLVDATNVSQLLFLALVHLITLLERRRFILKFWHCGIVDMCAWYRSVKHYHLRDKSRLNRPYKCFIQMNCSRLFVWANSDTLPVLRGPIVPQARWQKHGVIGSIIGHQTNFDTTRTGRTSQSADAPMNWTFVCGSVGWSCNWPATFLAEQGLRL